MGSVQESVLCEFRMKGKAAKPRGESRLIDKMRPQLGDVHVNRRVIFLQFIQFAAQVHNKQVACVGLLSQFGDPGKHGLIG